MTTNTIIASPINGNSIPINEKIIGKRIEAKSKNTANLNINPIAFIIRASKSLTTYSVERPDIPFFDIILL